MQCIMIVRCFLFKVVALNLLSCLHGIIYLTVIHDVMQDQKEKVDCDTETKANQNPSAFLRQEDDDDDSDEYDSE